MTTRGEIDVTARPRARSTLFRVGGLVLLLAIGSYAGYRFGWFDIQHTLHHIESIRRVHSLAGFTIGFVVVYGVVASIGLPAMPFTIAAGVLFGTVIGTVVSWFGAMLSAVIGYWVARTVGHKEVSRWAQRVRRVCVAVEESRDFGGMLRLRLLPLLPLGTVNFVGGLARAKFWTYMAATAIGSLPALMIYCYFADSLAEGVGPGRQRAISSLIISSALLIVLSLAPKLMTKSSRA